MINHNAKTRSDLLDKSQKSPINQFLNRSYHVNEDYLLRKEADALRQRAEPSSHLLKHLGKIIQA